MGWKKRFGVFLLGLALAASAVGQGFAVGGRALSPQECSQIKGGETYVDIDVDRQVARVTSIPRDDYGLDYSRTACYSVAVHNRVSKNIAKNTDDCYQPDQFPKGAANMSVASIDGAKKSERYGSSAGEWITTDASRQVTAYPYLPDRSPDKANAYTREDWGYYWHANNAFSFDESVSFGCFISPQKELDRVISTLKADKGRKRITVE